MMEKKVYIWKRNDGKIEVCCGTLKKLHFFIKNSTSVHKTFAEFKRWFESYNGFYDLGKDGCVGYLKVL